MSKSAKNKQTNNFNFMEKSNSGMHGHGMPIETREVPNMRVKRDGNEIPTKGTTTTTIHESKQFPFQIVEITTTNEKTKKEYTRFKIGMCGHIVSEIQFTRIENAEKYIASKPWELITNMVCITYKVINEHEKSKSNR